MKNTIKELKAKGFVTLTYPTNLRKAVDKTVKSWKKFCDLSEEIKKGLPYSNNTAGVGYELKDGVGNKADRKENFDITVEGVEWLQKNRGFVESPIALNFIENSVELVKVMKPIIMDFARQCEEEFNLKDFAKEANESIFFVSFIHYFGDRKLGDETASAHVDQSGFTLHLFESAKGLQCFSYNGKWMDMPVGDGKTVIIPAMQMQLRSKGQLKALCHRVIATKETAEKGRYSAVCFVQLKNTPKYDKERNGRLQEKPTGFNYKMSQREFEGLFKK